jgi:hypothetical protein
MTEEDRIKKINTEAAKHLENILLQLENDEISSDDLLAITYAHLIASTLAGYNPESFCNDALVAAKKIIDLAEETEGGAE